MLNVSRETLARLEEYVALLVKWQRRVNLVAESTLADVWRRHVLDSGQLYRYIPPNAASIVDIGSGAGFPGLVLAIMGVTNVELIESKGKKCHFLSEVAATTKTRVTIHQARAEQVATRNAAIVTARAVAPLDRLLEVAFPFFGVNTVGLFSKGQHVDGELTAAHKCWNMSVEKIQSVTDSSSTILRVSRLRHVRRK
ncbi:MAG: 16S rRNA (guanine(527)-N(7))-methyltransferase RsmG [Alphaproteobacteria bacterium]|nr:16S rRNA (guanine(527)-N(7))-methyltransferase RsmG [Alphaproteobacteria bacterium]